MEGFNCFGFGTGQKCGKIVAGRRKDNFNIRENLPFGWFKLNVLPGRFIVKIVPF